MSPCCWARLLLCRDVQGPRSNSHLPRSSSPGSALLPGRVGSGASPPPTTAPAPGWSSATAVLHGNTAVPATAAAAAGAEPRQGGSPHPPQHPQPQQPSLQRHQQQEHAGDFQQQQHSNASRGATPVPASPQGVGAGGELAPSPLQAPTVMSRPPSRMLPVAPGSPVAVASKVVPAVAVAAAGRSSQSSPSAGTAPHQVEW